MTEMTDTEARFITLHEAGRRVGVSYWTMQRRVQAGLLPAYRTGPNSDIRVKVADVDALLVPVRPDDPALAADPESVVGQGRSP